MNINLCVVDLSHWDPAQNYNQVKQSGVCGVIYKATQGTDYTDPTYKEQKQLALAAGIKWGSYHFGDDSDPEYQAENYLMFAQPQPDELFCLDFEDNSDNSMGLEQARTFIGSVESALSRPGECVFYSGNRIKDLLGNKKDEFFGSRRLWLAQYANDPICQCSWSDYWIWQYTDGQYGPKPHTVDGCESAGVDCNHYDGTAEQLCAEWASGIIPVPPEPGPEPSPDVLATVTIIVPPGIQIKVVQRNNLRAEIKI